MTLRTTLLAATILAVPLGAAAQPISGLYVGLGGGGNVLQDQQSRPSPGLGLAPKQFNWNVGTVGLGSVGYGFGNGLRVEVEGHYRYNALERFGGTARASVSGGEQQEYGAMVNALYDLDIGSPYVFPYFGVGGGYAHTELHKIYGANPAFDLSDTDSTNGFGYQGILGAAFPAPWVPGLSLTAEYRFFAMVDDQAYQGAVVTPGAAGLSERRGELRLFNDYNHSLLVGLRYAFNTAPPPAPAQPSPAPVAAPAPAPSRTYLVFFDWDHAELTGRARQIIAEAAQAVTRVQTTRIEVNGYTDLSGTAAYNQRLSVRRADAVAAELVRDGIARNEIAVQGFGESDPLVPTAAGVREPQNRRVQIILH